MREFQVETAVCPGFGVNSAVAVLVEHIVQAVGRCGALRLVQLELSSVAVIYGESDSRHGGAVIILFVDYENAQRKIGIIEIRGFNRREGLVARLRRRIERNIGVPVTKLSICASAGAGLIDLRADAVGHTVDGHFIVVLLYGEGSRTVADHNPGISVAGALCVAVFIGADHTVFQRSAGPVRHGESDFPVVRICECNIEATGNRSGNCCRVAIKGLGNLYIAHATCQFGVDVPPGAGLIFDMTPADHEVVSGQLFFRNDFAFFIIKRGHTCSGKFPQPGQNFLIARQVRQFPYYAAGVGVFRCIAGLCKLAGILVSFQDRAAHIAEHHILARR